MHSRPLSVVALMCLLMVVAIGVVAGAGTLHGQERSPAAAAVPGAVAIARPSAAEIETA